METVEVLCTTNQGPVVIVEVPDSSADDKEQPLAPILKVFGYQEG